MRARLVGGDAELSALDRTLSLASRVALPRRGWIGPDGWLARSGYGCRWPGSRVS